MRRDEGKQRAWQARGARRYAQRQREALQAAPAPRTVTRSRKPSDAPWRAAVIALRGAQCRRCRATWDLQADHVMPRSQGGPSVVENGTMLCRACHTMKTEWRILYERAWLDADQIAWLAQQGWVEWDENGEPRGRGCRGFASL